MYFSCTFIDRKILTTIQHTLCCCCTCLVEAYEMNRKHLYYTFKHKMCVESCIDGEK